MKLWKGEHLLPQITHRVIPIDEAGVVGAQEFTVSKVGAGPRLDFLKPSYLSGPMCNV